MAPNASVALKLVQGCGLVLIIVFARSLGFALALIRMVQQHISVFVFGLQFVFGCSAQAPPASWSVSAVVTFVRAQAWRDGRANHKHFRGVNGSNSSQG